MLKKAVLLSIFLVFLYLPEHTLAQNNTVLPPIDSNTTVAPPIDSNTTVAPPINSNTTITPTASHSGCSSKLDCSSCTKEWLCVWCENGNQSVCVDGMPWGSGKTTCGGYRWALCSFTGKFLLIVACVILGVFVLLIILCICCCCCRKKRKEPQYHRMERINSSSDDAYISRHPKTDKHREKLYEKWGDSFLKS
eukprot:TRINITY_DN2741_c0_g1_i1.p1 TRINITY_DN2741_c0_g1~~TRINITY_DN2741_c0_g1_i1.p1  ORF type:complete len:206 (-),score=28.03 TRINITY_DN2741_c0_g1_i1:69-650(-)